MDFGYRVDLDVGRAFLPLQDCPRCRASDDLEPVFDGDDIGFRCGNCHACWHVELGEPSRNHPGHCIDCRHRPHCLAEVAGPSADGGQPCASG